MSDTTPYGKSLAERVTRHLEQHGAICKNVHRDYCGVALGYENGVYFLDYVNDGDFVSGPGDGPSPIASFDSRAAFVEWLARQSDMSLSGAETGDRFIAGNQRVTRRRLEAELARR